MLIRVVIKVLGLAAKDFQISNWAATFLSLLIGFNCGFVSNLCDCLITCVPAQLCSKASGVDKINEKNQKWLSDFQQLVQCRLLFFPTKRSWKCCVGCCWTWWRPEYRHLSNTQQAQTVKMEKNYTNCIVLLQSLHHRKGQTDVIIKPADLLWAGFTKTGSHCLKSDSMLHLRHGVSSPDSV